MTGYIHSLQSLGTVDGPGVRAVVFAAGCPLRCVYCHNPDTWQLTDGTPTEHGELVKRILRLYPYIKEGGVTFSGGEPCLQAEFFSELAKELSAKGLHIALDTSGCVWNEKVEKLLCHVDLVLLDLKFTSEEDYKRHTGGSLKKTLDFLKKCQELNKNVWIRHVVVPSLTDSKEEVMALSELIKPYPCVKKIELLPFRKLCIEKYENLGIAFPLADTEECSEQKIMELYTALR